MITCCCLGMFCSSNRYQLKKFGQIAFSLFAGVVVLLTGRSVTAGETVTLTWASSHQPGVVGYKIYYGAVSHNYDHCVNVGNTNSITVAVSAAGATNYFATTAYDADGNESDFSEETMLVASSTDGGSSTAPADLLTSASYASGKFSFMVGGMTGASYVVQMSTNMMDWVSVQTNTAPFQFEDAGARDKSQCFYRAVPL